MIDFVVDGDLSYSELNDMEDVYNICADYGSLSDNWEQDQLLNLVLSCRNSNKFTEVNVTNEGSIQ